MFKFSGLIKALGIGIFAFISVSFLMGLTSMDQIPFSLSFLYIICYILIGILAPLWNPETPYTASYLASITMTVLNLLFAYFILDILVFAEPISINSGLVRNSLVALVATFVFLKISVKKREMSR